MDKTSVITAIDQLRKEVEVQEYAQQSDFKKTGATRVLRNL